MGKVPEEGGTAFRPILQTKPYKKETPLEKEQ
jgi:hypothetical protein